MALKEGDILWRPSEEMVENAEITKFMSWIKREKNIICKTYEELWEWSVTDLERFWESIWEYFQIKSSAQYDTVLTSYSMPGAKWFPGAKLNYAEHIFRKAKKGETAIYFQSEISPYTEMSWDELMKKTASVAFNFKKMGVQPGDRVVGYLPNIPETVISFLAAASIGAIWSSCAPEFGKASALSRFQQIKPKVFIAADGYQYNGKAYNKMPAIQEIEAELPSIEKTIIVPYLNKDVDPDQLRNGIIWDGLLHDSEEIQFEQVPFEHPLWIVYSSGTTGLPKSMVHGHGGILLNQYVTLSLQGNLKEQDRHFYYTTTGWIVWNNLISALLTGAGIVLYDGSPSYPDLSVLWRLAEKTRATSFGASPAYIMQCMKANMAPGEIFDLTHLKKFSCTGSPLSGEAFQWIYKNVKQDIWLAPVSGGTDVCGPIVGASPITPVYLAEMSCRCLGVSVYSYDDDGNQLVNEMGEMVITKPMPSMPVFFWNDPDGERYRNSYFDKFPGIWRHGDLLEITDRGSAIIYGRSDATINRMGIRAGSSEIYSAVESMPEILDSLVVDLSGLKRKAYMPLFVVLREGCELTDEMKTKINNKIRDEVSPRHVPDDIYAVPSIPMTLSGKKMEIPVRKILQGESVEQAANVDNMQNPESVHFFVKFAESLKLT